MGALLAPAGLEGFTHEKGAFERDFTGDFDHIKGIAPLNGPIIALR
jgi:hypothetical protein